VSRARIVALVAIPVLLLGGCRAGLGSDDGAGANQGGGTAPVGDSSGSSGSGASGGGAEQQFDDVESTLNSIERDMAGD
jgi:hypothetical protein